MIETVPKLGRYLAYFWFALLILTVPILPVVLLAYAIMRSAGLL